MPDFDLPAGDIVPVDTVDLRLAADTHPFEARNGEAIDRY